MAPSRRLSPALAVLLSALAGCGGGEGSTGAEGAASATPVGGQPAERVAGARPAGTAAPPKAPKPTGKPSGSDGRGGTDERDRGIPDRGAARSPGARADRADGEPRTLRELDAAIRKPLDERGRLDLAELTEQILREGSVDSCPEYLKSSDHCP